METKNSSQKNPPKKFLPKIPPKKFLQKNSSKKILQKNSSKKFPKHSPQNPKNFKQFLKKLTRF
jgi:hypothetical protein